MAHSTDRETIHFYNKKSISYRTEQNNNTDRHRQTDSHRQEKRQRKVNKERETNLRGKIVWETSEDRALISVDTEKDRLHRGAELECLPVALHRERGKERGRGRGRQTETEKKTNRN